MEHTKIIVSNLDELIEMWAEDCPIDSTEIAKENSRIPVLHQKYLSIEKSHDLITKKLEAEYNHERLWYWRYYQTKYIEPKEIEKKNPEFSQNEKVLRTNVDTYLDAEEGLNKIWLLKESHKAISEYAKNVVWQLKDRTVQLQTMMSEAKHNAGN